MGINGEKIKTNINNDSKINQFSDSAVTILNMNDTLFKHANIFDIKNQNVQSNLSNSLMDFNNEFIIVDASRITRKLETEDFRLKTPKSLNSEIDIAKEEKKLKNDTKNLCNNWVFSFIYADASYGLTDRKKERRNAFWKSNRFFKCILYDLDISIKDILRAYSVSSSVLNRIKEV